jgi:folate-binding protein YgfZ
MTSLIAARASAVTSEIAGRSVVLHFGEPAGEYEALRRGALLIDRSARSRVRVTGAKAADVLTGLVTNDVGSLLPGQGQYAAALTAKGKIVADVRIFAEAGSYLVDAPPRAAAGWLAMLKKFVNPRLAPVEDISGACADLGLFGVRSRETVSAVTGVSSSTLEALPPYAHLSAAMDGTPVTVARVPDLELEGYELFVDMAAAGALWQRLTAAGATPAGLSAFEIARIEAGRPEWGIDIDDTTIPQEANFDDFHAISYTKGCYVGQETVARVHFRGHVNRHLRGLRSVADRPLPFRAQLRDAAGKPVGEVRSAVLSPRLGGVALGMVRREVPAGATLAVTWEGGESRADVAHLPFAG